MKYIILMIIALQVFALKIEDKTTKEKKEDKKVDKKVEKEHRSNATMVTDVAVQHRPEDKKEEQVLNINPKADDIGRVFIIPSFEYNMSFASEVDTLMIINSDFEYNTSLIDSQLAIYGNLGFGFVDKYFLLHIEGGAKYNLPRLTRFLKPFLKLGVTLNPYFTSAVVYTPIAATMGLGFKFFINSNLAIEESQEFQIGNQLNNPTSYMSMRFKLGVIFIF